MKGDMVYWHVCFMGLFSSMNTSFLNLQGSVKIKARKRPRMSGRLILTWLCNIIVLIWRKPVQNNFPKSSCEWVGTVFSTSKLPENYLFQYQSLGQYDFESARLNDLIAIQVSAGLNEPVEVYSVCAPEASQCANRNEQKYDFIPGRSNNFWILLCLWHVCRVQMFPQKIHEIKREEFSVPNPNQTPNSKPNIPMSFWESPAKDLPFHMLMLYVDWDTLPNKAEIATFLYCRYHFRQPHKRLFSGHSMLMSVCFIMTGSRHDKGPDLLMLCLLQQKTYSTSCNWHWNSSAIKIPLSIRQHSNYVLFISALWVRTGWYGSGECDAFFITEWVYPARPLPPPLPLPPAFSAR